MGNIMDDIKTKIDEYLKKIIEKPDITKEEFELLLNVYDRHAALDKYMDLFKIFEKPTDSLNSSPLSVGVSNP